MAEFQDVVRQLIRLCEKQIACDKCPIDKIGCIGNVAALRQPGMIEETVMSWAAENPEPIYPLIIDVLKTVFNMPKELDIMQVWGRLSKNRISADVAEKLGVEPVKPRED